MGSKFPKIKGYILTEMLGEGAFGMVYKGYRESDYLPVVVKFTGSTDLNREVNALTILSKSPNCNQYIVCMLDFNESGDYSYLIEEYEDGADMYSSPFYYRSDYPSSYREPTVAQLYDIFSQLIEGLAYIHVNGVAHRDIKPENILATTSGRYKYFDFGAACDRTETCLAFHGTVEYTAPEVLQLLHTAKLSRLNTSLLQLPLHTAQKSDVWSLGVTFYQLINKKLPYNLEEIITTYSNALMSIQTNQLTFRPARNAREDFLFDLVTLMLNINPVSRISSVELLQMMQS